MDKPIETAASLYREMKNRGLHLRRKNGRDDAIIVQIASRIGCKDLNLQAFLDESNLSAQEFMTQFIDIAQPFALMFNEIWNYLSTYAAHDSSESISIRFGFPESLDKTLVTIEQFRRYIERIEHIFVSVHLWPEEAILTLYEIYQILLRNIQGGKWNYNYQEGKPYRLRTVQSVGHPFDKIAMRIQRLLQRNIDAFVEKDRVTTQEIFTASESGLSSDTATVFPTRRLTADLLPFWQIIFDRYDHISDKLKTEALKHFEEKTKPLLHRKEGPRIRTVREALDIIDLPFWRHRWHTYEVWATIATLRVLRNYNPIPRVNENSIPIDGYDPAIVADLNAEEYENACVAIQVQTPYVSGRRKAIRPDLRVCFSDRFEAKETAAIVEFKQRLRLSQKEVTEVITAYSGGSPNCAGIVLLNYDSVPRDMAIPHGSVLIGDVHPCNQEAIAAFEGNLKRFLEQASLRPQARCKGVLTKELQMEAFNPRDYEDEAHGMLWSHKDSHTKWNLWSAVAAHAEEISYSYEYLEQFVRRQNSRGSGYIEDTYPSLPMPTRLEFLEILEFREGELNRALSNSESNPNWQWPPDWKPSWNSYIISSRQRNEREFDLNSTRTAISVHKCLLGENVPIELDWFTRELVAELYNIFLHHGHFKSLPKLIPIVKSYDYPVNVRQLWGNDNQGSYDIDDVLGQYARLGGGREEKVRLFVRAINQCAQDLSLNEYHLKNIVILHELSHWLVHLFAHYPTNNPIDDRQDLLSAWHKGSDSSVHVAWAQLLTYFVVVRGGDGIGNTFNKLLSAQSSDYHKFREVLSICDDKQIILDSLIVLREEKKIAYFNDWMAIIRRLKG